MHKDVQGAKTYHKNREDSVLHQKYTIKSTAKNRTRTIVSKKQLIKAYVFLAIWSVPIVPGGREVWASSIDVMLRPSSFCSACLCKKVAIKMKCLLIEVILTLPGHISGTWLLHRTYSSNYRVTPMVGPSENEELISSGKHHNLEHKNNPLPKPFSHLHSALLFLPTIDFLSWARAGE